MSEKDDLDPGASTQMFKAYVEQVDAEPPRRRSGPIVAILVLVALVVVATLLWRLVS